MKNYFYLQLKRVAKFLPLIMVVTIILLSSFVAILYVVYSKFNEKEENLKYSVAIAGDTDNQYFKLALNAVQVLDETKFSVDFVPMSEKNAQKALAKGEVSAYVVIPENFIENAISGTVNPITFVTSAGMEGVTGLFKKEITTLVTDMVIYSQKGTYGLYDALEDNGLQQYASMHMDRIGVEYAELIFQRNRLYSVDELGISDGLSTKEYYVCAVIILLLVLIGLPFCAIYIKKDYSFNRLFFSRGYSIGRQVVYEYLAHLFAILFLIVTVIIIVAIIIINIPWLSENLFSSLPIIDIIAKVIPIVIMLSAFNMFMFEVSDNIVSGLLLHFFTVISLCFISGCMYPIYVFPDTIKEISSFLPIGIARSYLASSFVFEGENLNLLWLFVYFIAFLGLTWFIRVRKIKENRG